MQKLNQILGYQLGELLGKGSFSEVYKGKKGEHMAASHQVAIKLMRPQSAIDPQTILSSLRYEFWVLKDLVHPNIVRLFDFGQLDDGRIFLIEEFLEGETLDQFCRNRSFAECEPVLIGILQGLQELDRWHIVHGDLKPANILVGPFEAASTAKILDFGMARLNRTTVRQFDSGKRKNRRTVEPSNRQTLSTHCFGRISQIMSHLWLH